MSGVGHDPAVQFERHRRSQREERERRAALAAAGEADAAAYENPEDARRLDFGTTGVLKPVGSMRDVKCRVEARLASLQQSEQPAAERESLTAAASSDADPVEPVDEVAAAKARLDAAKRKRPRFEAGRAMPLASAMEPDKLASVSMRRNVQSLHATWLEYVGDMEPGWAVDGWDDADLRLEKLWAFVRDALINARRQRCLMIEDLEGQLVQTIDRRVKLIRDWLIPELYPWLCRGRDALTVGEWRSLWGRVLSRTAAEFAGGTVDALAWSTAAAGSTTEAGVEAARHRRKQTT